MKKVLKFLYRALPFKKQLYLTLKKVWTPRENIYKHLHFKGVFKVKVDDCTWFELNHYGYQIENEIFWNGLTGGWEKISMAIWIALCKKSMVIIDIGANTGIYSLVAKATHPAAEVYAFEPVKRVYSKLVDNNRLNGYDVACHELAVSNVDGQALIYDTTDDHILSVTLNKNLHHPETTVIPTLVRTVRLSSLIEKNEMKKIDLIKIDVETHEPEVLEGLGPYLSRDKPAILIEVLNDDIGKQIEKIVQGNNYLYFNIDEQGGTRRTESILKSDHYNYLLCQRDTAHSLGLIS
jgi:FkbM family methyltransferase